MDYQKTRGFFLKKFSSNQGVKTIFFLRTQKTLPINQKKKPSHAHKCIATAKPRNMHFWLLKHALFIPTSHNNIYKHV
jgi:hypothetical protein